MAPIHFLTQSFYPISVAMGNQWTGQIKSFQCRLHWSSQLIPRRCAGLLGGDPFSISDLSSGTLFPSLLDMPRHSPLSSQNWKPTSSLLPTDLLLPFFCFHQTHDYYACVFAVCLCVCVCVCACMCVLVCGVFVYVCACVCVASLSAL